MIAEIDNAMGQSAATALLDEIAGTLLDMNLYPCNPLRPGWVGGVYPCHWSPEEHFAWMTSEAFDA